MMKEILFNGKRKDNGGAVKISDTSPTIHAKWLNVNEEENVYMCSECGDEVIFISGSAIQNGYKYCPFCGAKMGKRLRNNGKRNKLQSEETR